MKNKKLIFPLLACMPLVGYAQEMEDNNKIAEGDTQWRVEMQGSFSKGKTPLWLNANKYGLSSLESNNGYLRASLAKPLDKDMEKKVAWGYVLDLAVPLNYTSDVVVQQAFVEGRWLHGTLTLGAKEYPMELKNQTLSSGSQTLGINARPVPQVRLALPDYWALPILHGWVQLKGHIAFGMMTDDGWQHDFTHRQEKYADHVLYHSKAGYLRIGNENMFCPLSLELGLEMAAQFAGTPYARNDEGVMVARPTEKGLKSLWHAFVPGGQDATDGEYANVAGNMLGSWLMRINYDADTWKASLYADHFFEDDSQMFLLDYNGYGEGDEWQVKKQHRYFRYALKDMLWGAELNIKYGRWLRDVVVEYVYTKYQSGPYNHDHTMNIADHVSGMDDYYNHSSYTGWQHWGQVMGNPLYRSPLYNKDGKIEVKNNRFIAYHLGFDGQPTERFGYRALLTYQEGWGRYHEPFTTKHRNTSWMLEGNYRFAHGWNVKAAFGMDLGKDEMYGENRGFQLTVCKKGVLSKKKEKINKMIIQGWD